MFIDFYAIYQSDGYRARHRLPSSPAKSYDITNSEHTAKIKEELKLRFPSFKVDSGLPFIISFTDKSDEAAFLLWSSDGIEI